MKEDRMTLVGRRLYMLIRDWPEGGTSFLKFGSSRGAGEDLIRALRCGIDMPKKQKVIGIRRRYGGVYLVRHGRRNEYEILIIPDSDDPGSFIRIHDKNIRETTMFVELGGRYNTPKRVKDLKALGFTEISDETQKE